MGIRQLRRVRFTRIGRGGRTRGGRRTLGVLAVIAALSATLAPPAAAAVTLDPNGRWEPLGDWPLIAIHAALTTEGDVITYGTKGAFAKQTGSFIYDIWDPASGDVESGHTTLDNTTPTDIFCNLQLNNPADGNLVMFGGDLFVDDRTLNLGNSDIVQYDPVAQSISSLPGMALPRWYASGVTLPDGRMYVQGGLGGEAFPEVWDPVNGAQPLDLDTTELYWFYPRLFVIPDGRIFGFDTNGRMFTIDAELASLTQHGKFAPSGVVGDGSSAVQYAPGRIIQFGGRSNHTYYIDLTQGDPVVTRGSDMSRRRSWVDGVLLPDGRVLAIGGSGAKNELIDVSLSAEIWDPETGEWTEYSTGEVARLYHSTALLLPDGSVLVAGGGAPGPLVNANAEIYKPGYMVTEGGAEPPRPSIELGEHEYDVGDVITLASAEAATIEHVRLVKTGSVTHSFNLEQRMIELPFSTNTGAIAAAIPESSSEVTPGSYLLFLVDDSGVVSEAELIDIAPSDTIGPVTPPPPQPPGPNEPPPPTVERECALRREQVGITLTWNQAAGRNVRKNNEWVARVPERVYFDPAGLPTDFYAIAVKIDDGSTVITDCIDDGVAPPPVTGECVLTSVGGGNAITFTDPLNTDDNWNIRRNGDWLVKVIGVNSYVDTEGVDGDTYQVRYWIPDVGRQEVECRFEAQPPPATPCVVDVGPDGAALTWELIPGEDLYSIRKNGAWLTSVRDRNTYVDPDGTADDTYVVRNRYGGVATSQQCS